MRKILYSPGYGAGWSTWMSVPTKFACEYQPIIQAIENKEKLTEDHPAVQQFVKEAKEKYDENVYLGGLVDLCIFTCDDDVKVRIHEYDGSESVITSYSDYF